MANKIIKFNTKIFHNSKVYLKVSDVAKVFNMKVADFKTLHLDIIEKITSCGDCILETDFNKLLSDDNNAMNRQEQLEITNVETLRTKIDAVISLQQFKILLSRNILKQVAYIKGCKSIEEYITKYELPEEMNKSLKELLQNHERNTDYKAMIDYTFHKISDFDIEKIRAFGLDVQVLTTIKCDGRIDLDVFVVGKGVFHRVTDLGNYELWNKLNINNNGDLILPFCAYDAYDSNNPEEIEINISQSGIDRDFSKYGVIDNIIWCIENLKVTEIEDFEYDVIGCDLDTVQFSVPIELLIKMIRPDAVSTIYIDKIINFENEYYLTDVKDMKVFAE